MRHRANLLKRTINAAARFLGRLIFQLRGALFGNSIHRHFGRSKLLPQAVVEFPGNASAFFILHAHKAAGKVAQGFGSLLDYLFEGCAIFPDRLLQEFAVMNVGAGPIPSDNLSILIAYRYCTGAKPAVLTGLSTNTVLCFVNFTGLKTLLPMPHDLWTVIGVHIVHPPETQGRFP